MIRITSFLGGVFRNGGSCGPQCAPPSPAWLCFSFASARQDPLQVATPLAFQGDTCWQSDGTWQSDATPQETHQSPFFRFFANKSFNLSCSCPAVPPKILRVFIEGESLRRDVSSRASAIDCNVASFGCCRAAAALSSQTCQT